MTFIVHAYTSRENRFLCRPEGEQWLKVDYHRIGAGRMTAAIYASRANMAPLLFEGSSRAVFPAVNL